MYKDRLPVREYLRHLRGCSLPELMDEECLAALSHIEAQYGGMPSFLAGIEVRLGDPRRFADYAFCTLDETLLPGPVVWLEIDYQAFREQGEIAPCMFLDIRGVAETEDPERHWSRIFPHWPAAAHRIP